MATSAPSSEGATAAMGDEEGDPHAAVLQAWARDMQRLLVHPRVRGRTHTCTCGMLGRGRPLTTEDSLGVAACACAVKPLQATGTPFLQLVCRFL
jgi:hypothetical protein